MFTSTVVTAHLGMLIFIISIPDATSYSKYGRTCNDIGCLSDEVCVMAEDPCSSYSQDRCGRYPTCRKTQRGEASCSSTVCRENEYCKTENGLPRCVKRTNGIGYESAGVSYVNGERVNDGDASKQSNNNGDANANGNANANANANPYANTNPYANANAPPEPVAGGARHHENTGGILGYPAYPNLASGTGSGNSGYPPYPVNGQTNRQHDLGYPPYPTQNKMPMPGQGYPSHANSGYPGQAGYPQAPGYTQQQYPNGQRIPAGQYPGYANYPYQNYPNQNHRGYGYNSNSVYRRNDAVATSTSFVTGCITGLALLLTNRL